jgi:sulfur dioxygenase
MIIKQFFDDDSSSYSYLVASQRNNSFIIDPVKNNTKKYIDSLDKLSLKLTFGFDTHLHADHITALGELRNITNCETIMGIQSDVDCVSKFVRDKEVITVDEIKITALYTPGHTDDSYCYLVNEENDQILFSGDTLLIGGNGRTDFQNGDPDDLFNSLHNIVLRLNDNTIIYPAHDYKGLKSSTIKEEKIHNKRLKMSKGEFISHMNNLNLKEPNLIDTAIPANQECGIIK